MKPYVLSIDGESPRIWEHEGVICAVIYRPEFDSYLVSVDYSPSQSTIFAPTPTLPGAIDMAEKSAENGPQDMKCCSDQ